MGTEADCSLTRRRTNANLMGPHMVRKPKAFDIIKGQMGVGPKLDPMGGERIVNKLESLEESPAGRGRLMHTDGKGSPTLPAAQAGRSVLQREHILPKTCFRCRSKLCLLFCSGRVARWCKR